MNHIKSKYIWSNVFRRGIGIQNLNMTFHGDLKSILHQSITSVLPNELIRKSLKIVDQTLHVFNKEYRLNNNCYLVGFGKAVLGMAIESENILGKHLISGIISVPKGIQQTFRDRSLMLPKTNSVLQIIEGANNNMPDQNSLDAALKIKQLVLSLKDNSILIVLISGGGSSLLPFPIEPITLQEKCSVIQLLADCGANIIELNTVRKRLSVLKGGGLAKLSYPVPIIALILSDVVGDPLDIIASGPTVVNVDPVCAAMEIIQKYNLHQQISKSVFDCLNSPPQDDICAVPIVSNSFAHVQNKIIGNNFIAVSSAYQEALDKGYAAVILSTTIQENVLHVAQMYIQLITIICTSICRNIRSADEFIKMFSKIKLSHSALNSFNESLLFNGILDIKNKKGLCLIAGGETTVCVNGDGVGGRNQELALMFAKMIHEVTCDHTKQFQVALLSAGTDGIDGPTHAAGAISDQDTWSRAMTQGLQPYQHLQNNDSHNFYCKFDDGRCLIVTGHTGTNVMDLHILVIKPRVQNMF